MAVTQGSTAGSSYTWAATWTWDDLRATKTWATAYGTSYTCTEADSAPNLVEARRSDAVNVEPQSFATAELRRATIGVSDFEAFATAEARSEVWTAARTIAEAFATAEARRSTIGAVDFEAFATAEARSDVWTASRTWAEAFSTAETYSDLIAWIQANIESFSTTTLDSSDVTRRALYEAFATSDARRSAVGVVDPEALALAEVRSSGIAARESEAFSTAEARSDVWTIVRTPAESFAVFEGRSSGVTNVELQTMALAEARSDVAAFARSFAESFATAEEQDDVISYVRAYAEAFSTAELRAASVTNVEPQTLATSEAYSGVFVATRTWAEPLPIAASEPTAVTKGIAESFATAEARSDVWTILRNAAETLSWTESYIDNIAWIQANAETLGLAGVYAKAVGNNTAESFATVDRLYKAIVNVETQTLGVAETYTDLISWIQANIESFSVAEAFPATIAKNILRSLAMRDMNLRNATGVFGDLSVRSTAMTPEAFAALVAARHPEGYDDFKEYLPGDYQFQRALLRVSLVPFDPNGTTLSLQSAKTTVDVPDLTDRGNVSVPLAGVAVTFNRTFYSVPEIQVQQTGGSGPALAIVSSLTTTGFFVRLYDAANPTSAVTGSVSWSVIGN